MERTAQNRESDARIAFGDLITLLGGATLLRTIIEDSNDMRARGLDGGVFSDACEDEPPTFMVAAREHELEFALGGEPSHVLPLQTAEALLIASSQTEAYPPLAA